MSSIEELTNLLKENLPQERLLHSLGVMKTAKTLAGIYGADEYKAQVAGLLHDCARGMSFEHQLIMSKNFGILLDDIQKREKALIHGPLGATLAREIYKITDEEIIHAIRIHTTGDIGMSCLDKIIFVSDFIEPGRCFPGVENLREKAFSDLDDAVLAAFNSTIGYIIDKGSLLHPKTVRGRNFLLMQRESEGKL